MEQTQGRTGALMELCIFDIFLYFYISFNKKYVGYPNKAINTSSWRDVSVRVLNPVRLVSGDRGNLPQSKVQTELLGELFLS